MFIRIVCILSALSVAAPLHASVIEYTNKAAWESVVGSFATIDFVLPPINTPITDQYADKGIVFGDFAYSHSSSAYPNDLWGLYRPNGGVWAHFDEPRYSIAVDYPGSIRFELFLDGESVYLSSVFSVPGPSGTGGFAGIVTSMPFDEAFLHKGPGLSTTIDDLHFGTIVPAPGALGLIVLGALIGPRRRRP
jgi:hypothetical protein